MEKFPKELESIMRGKDWKQIIRVDVIGSLDRWIWSFQFGLPGR